MSRPRGSCRSRAVLLSMLMAALLAHPALAGEKPSVSWIPLNQALSEASAAEKFIVVDFYTDWCGWCKRMDRATYADSAVIAGISQSFLAAKVNPERGDTFAYRGDTLSANELTRKFGIDGFPATVFLEGDGAFIGMVMGYIDAPTYRKLLSFVAAKNFKTKPFDKFIDGL